jgi:hypothetical protein
MMSEEGATASASDMDRVEDPPRASRYELYCPGCFKKVSKCTRATNKCVG